MDAPTQMIITILGAVLASSGLWTLINTLVQRKTKRKDENTEMLVKISEAVKGLDHDRILYLGAEYVKRGFITKEEYENLHESLYTPYKELGGNGTAEKIMREVDKLPIKDDISNLEMIEMRRWK